MEKEMEHFSQMTSMKFMRKKSSGEGLILCYHLEMQEKKYIKEVSWLLNAWTHEIKSLLLESETIQQI